MAIVHVNSWHYLGKSYRNMLTDSNKTYMRWPLAKALITYLNPALHKTKKKHYWLTLNAAKLATANSFWYLGHSLEPLENLQNTVFFGLSMTSLVLRSSFFFQPATIKSNQNDRTSNILFSSDWNRINTTSLLPGCIRPPTILKISSHLWSRPNFPLKGVICPYQPSLCNSITHQATVLEHCSKSLKTRRVF